MNSFNYKLNLKIYWVDLIISSILFLSLFYLTFISGSILAFCLSSIFLYRIGAFTHEIAHQDKNKNLKWFKLIWNFTVGFLVLQPSIRFKLPHLKHHTVGIFATKQDPQYPLIFSDFKLAFIIFFILPWFLPIYNLLICMFTSFPNNLLEKILYKKCEFTKQDYKEINLYEVFYCWCWLLLFVILNPAVLILFYFVSVASWFLSVLRIPLEHPLNVYKENSFLSDQKEMSFTHTNILYAIVQPLGLRFHTLHHMYPKIPYYKLKQYNYLIHKN